MENILLHRLTPDEFFEKLRVIVREELKIQINQDQLLTGEGALKMASINNVSCGQ